MSKNLDLARSIFVEWEHGDFGSAEWADPEIEYIHADGPVPGRRTGFTEMAEQFRDFLDAWDKWWNNADEYRELDDERVLVLTHYGGRGKTSGLEVGQMRSEGATVFHIHAGKVTKLVMYLDRDRALSDLGLEE